MCAAVSTMRRVLQPGHTPRPLHEYATKKSWPHFSQHARAGPCARMPHSKNLRRSRSTCPGTGSTTQSAPAASYPRAAAQATSPNSDAPLDTPHSVPAAGVDKPQPAALGNYQLRVSPACQQPRSLSRLKLKFQQPGATPRNHTRDRFN